MLGSRVYICERLIAVLHAAARPRRGSPRGDEPLHAEDPCRKRSHTESFLSQSVWVYNVQFQSTWLQRHFQSPFCSISAARVGRLVNGTHRPSLRKCLRCWSRRPDLAIFHVTMIRFAGRRPCRPELSCRGFRAPRGTRAHRRGYTVMATCCPTL